jgi:hypothetical protein
MLATDATQTARISRGVSGICPGSISADELLVAASKTGEASFRCAVAGVGEDSRSVFCTSAGFSVRTIGSCSAVGSTALRAVVQPDEMQAAQRNTNKVKNEKFVPKVFVIN